MTNQQLIYLIDDLLTYGKEMDWLEFKRGDATDNQRFGKYISGLANAANIAFEPYSYLIFGVDNDSLKIVGTNFDYDKRKEKGSELDFYIRRNLSQPISYQHFICDYNDKKVEIFKIPAAGNLPVYFENEAYIRISSNLTELKKYPNYLRQILNSQMDWSAQIVENATIDDLDNHALNIARQKFKEKSLNTPFYKDIDNWTNEQMLDKMRITLAEKINKLIFENGGGFFEGTADDYSKGEKTPRNYRNKWLTEAMVKLGMIDALGYGIHKMVKSQRDRYFPLPDYSHSSANEVILEIYGQSIDVNYSKLLIEKKDELSLTEVILLDKVQKRQTITNDASILLKKKNLIEGRKPNFYIASHIAEVTDTKAEYIKNRGFKDTHYKKLILDFIGKYEKVSKQEIDKLILDILPDILDKQQKENKVRNLIYSMHNRDKSIENKGTKRKPVWILSLSNQAANKK